VNGFYDDEGIASCTTHERPSLSSNHHFVRHNFDNLVNFQLQI